MRHVLIALLVVVTGCAPTTDAPVPEDQLAALFQLELDRLWEVTVGLPQPKRVRSAADRVPKVDASILKWGGSSAGKIHCAATPERAAPPKV